MRASPDCADSQEAVEEPVVPADERSAVEEPAVPAGEGAPVLGGDTVEMPAGMEGLNMAHILKSPLCSASI
jgi:hypothetical protein